MKKLQKLKRRLSKVKKMLRLHLFYIKSKQNKKYKNKKKMHKKKLKKQRKMLLKL